jgi:hypothetical protein
MANPECSSEVYMARHVNGSPQPALGRQVFPRYVRFDEWLMDGARVRMQPYNAEAFFKSKTDASNVWGVNVSSEEGKPERINLSTDAYSIDAPESFRALAVGLEGFLERAGLTIVVF